MTVFSAIFGIIFFLLHSSGESGFGQDDEFGDEEQDDYDFTCYSQLQVYEQQHTLTCSFNDSSVNSTYLELKLCDAFMSDSRCEIMMKREKDYFIQSRSFSLIKSCEMCVIFRKSKMNCKTLKITKIVKPEAPFNISVTYRKAANDFVLTFNTTHLWKDYVKELIHDVAYHQENNKSDWMHISSQYPQVTLLERKLQPNTSYEVKIRSLPGGNFFAGSWSDWSPSVYFTTPSRPKAEELNSLMVITIIITLSLFSGILGIVVMCFLWEKSIKPVLWPNLPDHKMTLEQLCRKPQKNYNISFNPESFLDYPIHKVDGIQAKEEVEGFLQVPIPRDINVTEKIGLNTDWPSENNIIPPLAYGGNSPSTCLCGNTCDLSMVTASKSPSHQENSKNEAHFCGGLLLNSDSRNNALTFPFPLRIGVLAPSPTAQEQPINENLKLSQEDAYVTMSSFYQNK